MKNLMSFSEFISESQVFEGSVKEFEMDFEDLLSHIKDGYGWIDPKSVKDTWMSISNIPLKPEIKEGLYKRLIKAGVLFHTEPNNVEKKGKKITKYTDITESVNEGKDDFVVATLNSNSGDLKKGDSVKVNALEYTQGGDDDKITIIRPDGKKDSLSKKVLNVKI
jgi:hypothetical protein